MKTTPAGIPYAEGVIDGFSAETSMRCATEFVVEHTFIPRLFCAVKSPEEADKFVTETIGETIRHEILDGRRTTPNRPADWRLIQTGFGNFHRQ